MEIIAGELPNDDGDDDDAQGGAGVTQGSAVREAAASLPSSLRAPFRPCPS